VADKSVVYRLRAEIGQFSAQMAQASASTRKLAGDLTAVDKEGAKTRRGLDTLGSAAGRIGLVAAAGLGAAVVKAADFDSSMSKVQAATHESAGAMERLRQAALDAGADTAFSATEAAAGIENLAKAGVSTEEILSGGLMGALDLAAAGEMDVADAAEAAAGAMAQFKLEGEDVPHIADLLAAGAGKAQGEVSDMVMALKQGGTVASQTGLTIEEMTGSLAAMAEQSLLGSDAGTSFKQMLASLTPNSEKAASAMEQYGISAFDAQGNFVGMVELARQLEEGLGNLTQEQRMATLETIFGSDAVRAASIIYDNGAEGVGNWIEKVNDAGYAAETAAIKQDNLRGDLEKLGGALETALIGTGEGAQGPLRTLVQGAEDLVNAFNDMPQSAKDVVAALGGITAVLGGGLWFGTKVINGVTSTREALENLGVSSEKSGRALRGLGKAAIGLAALETAVIGLKALQGAIDETLPGTEALTGRLIDLNSGAVEDLGTEFDSLSDSIGRLVNENRWEHAGDALLSLLSLGQLEGNRKTEARNEIEALDAALANLATSQGAEAAAASLQNLAEAQGLSAWETRELEKLLPQYGEAMAGAANETKIAAAEALGLEGAVTGSAESMAVMATMTEEQAKALEESRKAAGETAAEFFGLGEKVDKAKVSLGEWIRDLERQAAALRDFQRNAQEAGEKGLDKGLIAALEEAGPAGALRMRQLANATEAEIDRANKAWRRGQRAIDDYTDAVGGVPPATLRVDNGPALRGIDEAIDRLKDFKDKKITIRVTHAGTAAVTPGFGAQGGFAEGGWTGPGAKYQPAGVVHADEYVFSKEATHGNVAMLERLHRQLRGYAPGGLVQRHAAPVVIPQGGGGVSIDYDRLAGAMSRVAPLYGQVNMQPHNYGEFQRQMLQDRQAAGLGGI
jgi:TP901 family phage tail tape measure protein